jgi:hypothetical protein
MKGFFLDESNENMIYLPALPPGLAGAVMPPEWGHHHHTRFLIYRGVPLENEKSSSRAAPGRVEESGGLTQRRSK